MAIGDERAVPQHTSLPPETRNRLGGLLLLAAGATLLFVSLLLDWFEPGISAWTAFEVWDIVLAALALAAVMAAAGALRVGPPRPDSWALIPAVVAPVVVVVSLLNHPPAAQGAGQDPMIGIWLALAGSLLMLVGALLAVARISVALDLAAPGSSATRAGRPAAGGRFARDARGAPDPSAAPPPEVPAGRDGPTTPTRRVVP